MAIIEQWEFEVLSTAGQTIGVLDTVIPGSASLSGNINTPVRWGGQIQVSDPDRYDWRIVRIRPVRYVDGHRETYGVYLGKDSRRKKDSSSRSATIDLFDRTLVVSEDCFEDTFSVPAGKNLTVAISEILASTGEQGVSITPDSTVVRSDMVWEAGESKLRIINDLLDAAGYFSLWCDLAGQFRLEPYVRPQARPVVEVFDPGPASTFLPEIDSTADVTVCNKIICISQETGADPSMRSVAVNENPDSPWSFQRQRRWVARTERNVEAATQEILDRYAQRLLSQETGGGVVNDRRVLVRPFELNQIVQAGGRREVIETIKIECMPGKLMSVSSREVSA